MKGRFKSNEINDGSYPYQNIRDWQCPKCGLDWSSEFSIATTDKYCECMECSVGHYHKSCKGTSNEVGRCGQPRGCHFSFIMRAKS